ncbi:MAG: recombinase family protein [Clostridia bacterium]
MQTQTITPTQKRVDLIPANVLINKPNARKKKLRVAAYCRVSTEQEEQQSSYAAQIAYYTEKISQNKDWELAGIFADEGITGTSTKKREKFLELMALCEKGKIDMVLTKSVSRFSRNTLDAITYIRRLKAKGIPIIFEKEGINTMQMASEMALCFLSGFAQAESESISRNVTWGKRQSFKNGNVTFQYKRLLGYAEGEDGNPMIVPEEAEIVKRIFRSYYAGASVSKIKKSLEADGILSPTGKQEWSIGVLQYMIRNERYIGDALLQKTYVVDCLTKETRKNNGEVPQYYVTDNHEPIISRELFHLVQEEIARRAGKRKVAQKAVKTEKGKYSSKYALTERLCCGDCGTQYRRVTWARGGKKKVVWRCINRLEYGTKYCKESPTIEESRLHTAIVTALNQLDKDKEDVMQTLRAGLQLALGTQEDDGFNEAAIQNRIAELQGVMMDLVELSSKSSASADYFDAKFEELFGEIKELQDQLGEHTQQTRTGQNTHARISELLTIMEQLDLSVKEYRDDAVKNIITKVIVLNADRIRVIFDGGAEMEVELPGEQ